MMQELNVRRGEPNLAALAADVVAVENANDAAIAASARLIERMAKARSKLGASVHTAQPIYLKLAKMLSSQIDSQGFAADVHKSARGIADRMADNPPSWGVDEPCPHLAATDDTVTALRAA